MARGMPPGFADLIRRKYDILQQQADATTTNASSNRTAAEAGAALDTARARELPLDSAAQRALQGRQADFLGEQIRFYGDDILSQIRERGTRGAANLASAYQALAAGRINNDLVDTNANALPGGPIIPRTITTAPSITDLYKIAAPSGRLGGGAPSGTVRSVTSNYGKIVEFPGQEDERSRRGLGTP